MKSRQVKKLRNKIDRYHPILRRTPNITRREEIYAMSHLGWPGKSALYKEFTDILLSPIIRRVGYAEMAKKALTIEPL